MTPADLPLWLIPKRKPHPLAALAVMVGCLLFALTIRLLVFGPAIGQGMVSIVFPALIVATLYAGLSWGLGGLALVLITVVMLMTRASPDPEVRNYIALGLFMLSALTTVCLSGGLREIVLRLDETRRARDEALARLVESEERFRIAADSAPVMMWLSGGDDKFVFVNKAYCEFFGLTYEAALASDWRDYVHPDDLTAANEEVARLVGDRLIIIEARFRRADGEWRWLRSVASLRRSRKGYYEGFTGTAFDITDSKRSQEALKNVNDLLADRVQAAVKERDLAQAALVQSQKLESLGQLTGGVAHDFNNLLTVIIGALDIILRNPTDVARRQRLGEAALAAARRGERLTQQLLAFSRRQPLKPEVLGVDTLLREAEPLLRRAVGEGFNLRFELAADTVHARIDAAQFEAAVLNLLINARDATREDGRIVVSTAKVALTEARGETPPGHYVKVSVTDDGEGMSPETLARAFEPFFTTKPVGKGTGLGLSQVYGFVHQSGGAVEIDSAPGLGASISLMLPLTTELKIDGAARQDGEGQRALKVLLVEDDADVGDLVEAMLGELGHAVVRAENVERGLRLAAEQDGLGLVLTDVIMPGGRTGVDLAREVARRHPELPIILSSGYTGATVAEADRAPWPMLRKPYTIEDLKAAIADAVEMRVPTS